MMTFRGITTATGRRCPSEIVFVDPTNGDDGNDGRSAQAPIRTVLHAATLLHPGGVLRLHAGTVLGPDRFPTAIARDTSSADHHRALRRPRERLRRSSPHPELRHPAEPRMERVAGQPHEWRTRQVLNQPMLGVPGRGIVRFGAFVDSGIRLITYDKIDDLRAVNESLSRCRWPTLGRPVVRSCPTRRRRSHGPISAPGSTGKVSTATTRPTVPAACIYACRQPTSTSGIVDYSGPDDPNQVALGLTPEFPNVVDVGSYNVTFRKLVIRNGGGTTVNIHPGQSAGQVSNVTFDHCSVIGGRIGVRIQGAADGVRFNHCTFDGVLAPWTTRTDIKSNYEYLNSQSQAITNHLGTATHDILVISQAASNTAFAHCTFVRAHDAVQVGGTNVSIHHCLFQDINDEVIQFQPTSNARIWKNVIRQALDVFSFALNHEGGPIYIYRNVIDQRVPTRGYRALLPDVAVPRIWRYGSFYKMGKQLPDVFRLPEHVHRL